MSGCQTLLASGAYTTRHSNICRFIHYKSLEEFNLKRPPKFWDHKPDRITGNKDISIYYDNPIPIAWHIEIGCIKPDILIHNKLEKTAMIIEVGHYIKFNWNKKKYQNIKT